MKSYVHFNNNGFEAIYKMGTFKQKSLKQVKDYLSAMENHYNKIRAKRLNIIPKK